MSLVEDKETIIFDNLDIIDINESESELNEFQYICDINNNQKSNSIKMIKTKASKGSKNSKSKNKEENKLEEIHEVKYNLFLALTKKCIPAKNEFEGILEDKYFKAKRLMIQDIKLSDGKINYGKKKYVFIPKKENPNFEFEGNIIKVIKNDKSGIKDVKMYLNDNLLIDEEEFKKQCINHNINISKDNEISKNNEKSSNTSESNNDSVLSNKTDKKSKNSKKDNSSENEGINGYIFYYKIENEQFIKYAYYEDFQKEVDGVYCQHEEIQLNKKEIQLESKIYENLNNNYDNKNDLKAHIIIKNFEEESIPKNAPIILEIKKSFELFRILNQIKKASKIVKYLKKTNIVLPKYFIGVLCSFNEPNVMGQLNQLNENYNDTNNSVLFHINEIIKGNEIKFLIAVIKDGKINNYELGKQDFDFNPLLKRVDIKFMSQKLEIQTTQKELEDINRNFDSIYKSINLEKTITLTYKEYEEIKRRADQAEEDKKKAVEEKKKAEEDKKKAVEDKKKAEEGKKMLLGDCIFY